jgi:hypothetical protein
LRYEKLLDVYISHIVVRIVNLRACSSVGEARNAYRIFVEKGLERRSFWGGENNFKINRIEVGGAWK